MIEYQLEQGSDAWLKVRLGTATASNFSNILTPKGKLSTSYVNYSNTLLGNLISGKLEEQVKSFAMMRGNELEPIAVEEYQRITGYKIKELGFISTDDKRVGCSPDRLVEKDGLLEIKCPLDKTHVDNLLRNDVDPKYYPQVQGQLWLTNRDWCDFMSYHPDMPPMIVRVDRNEEYILNLKEGITSLLDDMDNKIKVLSDRGVTFAIQAERGELP